MANKNDDDSTRTNLLLRTPQQNEVATGFSAQGRPEDMRLVAKVSYKTLINKNIKLQLAVFSGLRASLAEAEKAYREAADAFEVPKDFLGNLETLHKAMLLFHKKVVLPVVPDDDEDYDKTKHIAIETIADKREIRVSAQFPKTGDGYGDGTLTVRRSYPWTKAIVSAEDAVRKARKAHDEAEEKLTSLRNALGRVDEAADEAAAVVAMQNLNSCGALGESLVASLDDLFHRRAAEEGLTVDETASTPRRLAATRNPRV